MDEFHLLSVIIINDYKINLVLKLFSLHCYGPFSNQGRIF